MRESASVVVTDLESACRRLSANVKVVLILLLVNVKMKAVVEY